MNLTWFVVTGHDPPFALTRLSRLSNSPDKNGPIGLWSNEGRLPIIRSDDTLQALATRRAWGGPAGVRVRLRDLRVRALRAHRLRHDPVAEAERHPRGN